MKSLNLRVYRRTLTTIALLWNQKALPDGSTKDVKVYLVVGGEARALEFITSDQMEKALEEGIMAPDSTTVMMIDHDKNHLDPYTDCKLRITYGEGATQLKHEILVYAFGVLPPSEKDDKKMNSHIYGFYEADRKWVKLPVVKCKDGSFAVPVKLIKE